jgi:hypothetical protein
MEPYIVEKSVTIRGGGMPRRVVIPARDLKEYEGMTFMHVSTVSTYVTALVSSGPQHGRRPLSKTNVIEQLSALRNATTVIDMPAVQDKLQAFGSMSRSAKSANWSERKKLNSKQMTTCEVDTIQSPTLGDAHGIEMKILKWPYRKNAPLYIELDAENLAYLRLACQHQIEHCDFKRHKAQKKVEDSVDDPDYNHVDDADAETEVDAAEVDDAEVDDAEDYNHVHDDAETEVDAAEVDDAEVDEKMMKAEVDDSEVDESPPCAQKDNRELLETPIKSADKSGIRAYFMKRAA